MVTSGRASQTHYPTIHVCLLKTEVDFYELTHMVLLANFQGTNSKRNRGDREPVCNPNFRLRVKPDSNICMMQLSRCFQLAALNVISLMYFIIFYFFIL